MTSEKSSIGRVCLESSLKLNVLTMGSLRSVKRSPHISRVQCTMEYVGRQESRKVDMMDFICIFSLLYFLCICDDVWFLKAGSRLFTLSCPMGDNYRRASQRLYCPPVQLITLSAHGEFKFRSLNRNGSFVQRKNYSLLFRDAFITDIHTHIYTLHYHRHTEKELLNTNGSPSTSTTLFSACALLRPVFSKASLENYFQPFFHLRTRNHSLGIRLPVNWSPNCWVLLEFSHKNSPFTPASFSIPDLDSVS